MSLETSADRLMAEAADPRSMRYAAYDRLAGRPNVIVDGAATDGTLLVLSHWQASGTPPALKADTSAEIALRWLAVPEIAPEGLEAEFVSNNHFDEDGLLGIWAILNRTEAFAHAERVVLASRAGDFGTIEEGQEDAGRIAFAIAARARRAEGDPYAALLPGLGDLVAHPERHAADWGPAFERFESDRARIRAGEVALEERPDLDLAIVRSSRPVDPNAVHSATKRLRILTLEGEGLWRLAYRYETWVEIVSRRVAPRLDVSAAIPRLQAIERAPGRWVFDGVADLVPALRFEDAGGEPAPSAIPADAFVSIVEETLAEAARDPALAWRPGDVS